MKYSEIVAAVEAHKQAVIDLREQYPKQTSRTGPPNVTDDSPKVCASIEDNASIFRVRIGHSSLGSSHIALTTTQCEWLRDVLMEWFPKENTND